MLWPVNINFVPRNGWTVDIEGCGPTIRSDHFSEFIKQLSVRLQANGKDRHGWKEFFVDLMCKQRPDIPSEDKDAAPTRAMSGDDVKRFLTTMWAGKENGAQPVPESLQNQRVDTCLACPKLGYISCFIGCQQITEIVNSFMMGRDVPKYPEIHKMACTVCGCTASVKSMWPIEILHEIDERMGTTPQYPSNCWVITESQGLQADPPSSPQPPPEAT